jgi:hypothetical protein
VRLYDVFSRLSGLLASSLEEAYVVFISVLDTEPFITAAKLFLVPVLRRVLQFRCLAKFIS